MKTFHGIGVSSGIAAGRISIWRKSSLMLPSAHIEPDRIPEEIARFEKAVARTEEEILAVQKKIEKNAGKKYGEIFTVHRALLQDRFLTENTIRHIRQERLNCEGALDRVIKELSLLFNETADDLAKERRRDLMDVLERLIRNLENRPYEETPTRPMAVVVSTEISPSQAATIEKGQVLGFVVETGSKTSHAAIVARALEIPAVVGLSNITRETDEGQRIIVDGGDGTVIINPTAAVLNTYRKKKQEFLRLKKQLEILKKLPAETPDGKRVAIGANIEFPEEVRTVKKYGAEGIGLYRTEYIYLNRKDLPSEDEQFNAYRKVAEQMKQHPVIIRTLDIGGDKFATTLNFPSELNPFLGWRAIRFCLERRDIFETQLKAILRASAFGDLRLMFPMISTLDELEQTLEFTEEVKDKLRKENHRFNADISTGIMIEVPSAALIAEQLGSRVNFFSVGTNDLIQYTMAVDRVNEKIAHLYQPCHPGVLELIQRAIDGAHRNGITVGICGEMASIPEFACLLAGMGVDELSMAPIAIPAVKNAIRQVSFKEMRRVVEQAKCMSTHREIYSALKNAFTRDSNG